MSNEPTQRSPRAAGGVADLRAAMLEWLRDWRALTERLEQVDGVDDAATVIRPANWLRRQQRTDGEPPNIVVTVGVFTGRAERDNLVDEKDHTGQVMLSLREGAAKALPGQWSDEVRDEIATVLTRNHDGWHPAAVPGGDSELAWNDNTDREELAITFDITYRGLNVA